MKHSRYSTTHAPLLLAACAALTLLAAPLSAGVFKQTIFTGGAEGYNIYRIPTIVRAANGDLLAFAEARSGGDASEIDIVMKRSTDDGKTWGALSVAVENDNYRGWDGLPTANVTAGNQTPVVDLLDPQHPGRIWMPFTMENDRVFVTYSDDHGATWTADSNGRAREITADVKPEGWGWYATGPVHGIQLTRGQHAGRLIIPSDHRLGSNNWGAHVVYSDDHGQTWRLGADDTHSATDAVHPNENFAIELVDGRVYFNARSQGGASGVNRAVAYSSDGGESFDARFEGDPQFITPVVQNSGVRFHAVDQGDAQNVLVYSRPGQPSSRQDMTISLSYDEGLTWVEDTVIERGSSAYSDLVKINATTVGVLYEIDGSTDFVFATFNPLELSPVAWNGVDGDVNQDGLVDASDLAAFVNVWAPLSGEFFLGGADSYTHGDLNFDGTQDIHDAIVLRQHLLSANVPTAGLGMLGRPVPEASTLSMGGSLALVLLGRSWRLTPVVDVQPLDSRNNY
ncbi:Sialidase precursor [Pirellulimonas nuda]|uniref:exo-alpha-sialidase n=1 Tax=Pirellulimonas nuda TaxID=2528009 RepID=A0A518DG85_9BACT|nr:exo-alpha-sialidase [Pirellulimonas nuda]QDU90486.1 Sialidase precursor [Pirellulimonas nuda]